MLRRTTTLALIAGLLGTTMGCGDDDAMTMADTGPGMDAGMEDGGGADDAGGGDVCAAPRIEVLSLGEQSLSGNTEGASSALALGEGCGNAPSPQEIVGLTIPGTGDVAVSFTLATEGTADFDTVVEYRPACASFADSVCFDDTGSDLRSSGTFIAEGGTTVFLVVTGFDGDASGGWQMDVEVAPATAPTLDTVQAYLVDDVRFELRVTGSDAEGNVVGYDVSFLDDAGAAIDVEGRTVFSIGFSRDLTGETSFMAESSLDLEEAPTLAAAVQAQVTLVDATTLTSDPSTVMILDLVEVGGGDACDNLATNICSAGYDCTDLVCTLPPATVTACEAATAITVTPGDTTATTTVTASIGTGDGAVVSSCGNTAGQEALYALTIGEGAFDLIVSTENEANEGLDTVVYVQNVCGDPSTGDEENTCSDDSNEEDFLSRVVLQDIAAGDYTLGVEIFGGPDATAEVELDVSLRPVLAAGAACDDAEIDNRCSTGACADSVCPDAT